MRKPAILFHHRPLVQDRDYTNVIFEVEYLDEAAELSLSLTPSNRQNFRDGLFRRVTRDITRFKNLQTASFSRSHLQNNQIAHSISGSASAAHLYVRGSGDRQTPRHREQLTAVRSYLPRKSPALCWGLGNNTGRP